MLNSEIVGCFVPAKGLVINSLFKKSEAKFKIGDIAIANRNIEWRTGAFETKGFKQIVTSANLTHLNLFERFYDLGSI